MTACFYVMNADNTYRLIAERPVKGEDYIVDVVEELMDEYDCDLDYTYEADTDVFGNTVFDVVVEEVEDVA